MEPVDASHSAKIDKALQQWRQGDCVLAEQWFVFRIAPEAPLTQDAEAAAADGAENAEVLVRGFAVLTQTCDIVRTCLERPFVEVCPLVEVEENRLHEIERGRRPSYAYIPGIANHHLVADLDRTMTVEKAVVAQWDRTGGCRNDYEVRRLSLALARKRARFAFPDDFVEFVKLLQARLSRKHDKNTKEGRALRVLREIRVRAAPSWDAKSVELMFWFIRSEEEPDFEGQRWSDFLQDWLNLIPARGRFTQVDGVVFTMDDLTAREYVESDPLDLDHLSRREKQVADNPPY